MAKISISKINFTDLLPYKKALESLNPASQVGNLNSSLIYSKSSNSLTLYIQDSMAMALINFSATIENDGVNEDFGFFMDFKKFFEIVDSYKEEVRNAITLELALGPSSFKLFTNIDKLSLPHLEMSVEQVYEVEHSPLLEVPEDFIFSLAQFKDRKDFFTGVANCLKFIGTTDKKNNALAVYGDKIIVNDRRHIFVYYFEEPIALGQEPISLHKLSAKIIGVMPNETFEYYITKDGTRALVRDANVTLVMNNSISNIMPPSEENLDSIRPLEKAFTIKAAAWMEVADFFNQFYTSSMEQSPITIDIGDQLTFILKDSGLSGYSSCNVERKVDVPLETAKASTSTVINSSLRSFLGLIVKDNDIDVFIDPEHPAVFLHTAKRKMYLAKLGGQA